jgi:hypothetical protein
MVILKADLFQASLSPCTDVHALDEQGARVQKNPGSLLKPTQASGGNIRRLTLSCVTCHFPPLCTMPPIRRNIAILAAIGCLIGAVAWLVWWKRPPSPPPSATAPGLLSALSEPPDWTLLDAYQHSISRSEFEHLLISLFTTGEGWREFIQLDDQAARIQTGQPSPADVYRLAFRSDELAKSPPRQWRTAAELPPRWKMGNHRGTSVCRGFQPASL